MGKYRGLRLRFDLAAREAGVEEAAALEVIRKRSIPHTRSGKTIFVSPDALRVAIFGKPNGATTPLD